MFIVSKIIDRVSEVALRFSPTRAIMNRVYNAYSNKPVLYERWSKRVKNSTSFYGCWNIRLPVRGASVLLPLRGDCLALEWDLCLSMLGHEPKVKQSWFQILANVPDGFCFVDVGTNFGQNTLVFLACQTEVHSFEPNPKCLAYLESVIRLNKFQGCVHPVAVGNSNDAVELVIPCSETWLGSTDPATVSHFATLPHERVRVPQVKLDDFATHFRADKLLIKLDVEGSELAVLTGARSLLRERDVIVLFEAWSGADSVHKRREIAVFFESVDFGLYRLPLGCDDCAISYQQFLASPDNDFAAARRDSIFLHEAIRPAVL